MSEQTVNTIEGYFLGTYRIAREDGRIVEVAFGPDGFGTTYQFNPLTGLPEDSFFGNYAAFTEVDVRVDDVGRPWTRIETRLDEDSNVVWTETIRDNGINSQIKFAEAGGRSVEIKVDATDAVSWSFRYATFDGDGNEIGETIIYDDDRIVFEGRFDGGTDLEQPLLFRSVLDGADDYNWTERTTYFLEDGSRLGTEVLYDDGRLISTVFEGEAGKTVRAEDRADAYRWTEIDRTFDETGALLREERLQDDGRLVTKDFEDGVLQRTQVEDTADAFAWSERTTIWNEDGSRDSQTVVRDDGRVINRDYEAGMLREELVQDVEDLFDWFSIQRSYDETGTLVSEVVFPDLVPENLTGSGPIDSPTHADLRADHEDLLAGQDPLSLSPPSDDYFAVA